MRKITLYSIISFLTLRVLSTDHSKASENNNWDKDRMEALVQYGETLLKHGRDTYGNKNTPLFSDYLEVSTLKAPEKMYIHRLGGPGPRSKQPFQPVISSNLAYQGNLMRFLVGLSNVTNNDSFKKAYKECISYHFKNYQVPNGLLQMGHHRWVNLNTDAYDGNDWPAGKSGHEMKRDYPYYPIFWETDPVATRRMLASHWSSHIQDWGFMNFTRHGSYVKELNEDALWNHPITKPVVGIVKGNLTFFDSGSDIIYAGAQLGLLGKNKKPLFWAKRLYARYSDSAHPKTGLPPWHHTSLREFGSPDEPVPEYALITRGSAGLLGNGGIAMLRIGEDLGKKEGQYYRQSMLSHLKAYAKYAYIAEENLLKNLLMDGTDLAEREKKNKAKSEEPPSAAWQPWSPDPTTITAYAICYKQSKDKMIWETLRSMIKGNQLGDIGEPGSKNTKLNLKTDSSKALLIFPLVELFHATNNKEFLNLGRAIANNCYKKHFRHKQGLFTPSELHRTANLCSAEPLALLTLEAALREQSEKVPTYAGSNEGEAIPYLRPLKIRPYKPKASHLAYSYATESICDDLLPASSSDTTVPVMAWQNVKKATNKAVVDFPDILEGPVTIEEIIDHSESRNSISEMNINSKHSYTFDGNLNGAGDLTLNILQGSHHWSPGSSWTTTGWSHTGTYNLIMNVNESAQLTFNGLIQENQNNNWYDGSGVIKDGPGTAEMTADYSGIYRRSIRDNRAYRAPTIINDGILLISNKEGSGISPSSSLIVNHGGTLGGTGTIGLGATSSVVTINAGGKITPGKEIGTLTLKDGLTLNNGSRLEFDAGEESDLLRITGGTFRGAGRSGVVITVNDAGGMKPGKSYDLIDWAGASFVDVDVSDFRLDKSKTFQGSFHIVDSKLQFSVFAPRLVPETPPEFPDEPKPTQRETVKGYLPPKISNYTWTNSNGGNWSEPKNWKAKKIPNTKETEWVDYSFEKAQKISKSSVYWFDNGGDKKVPESWRILFWENDNWKEIQTLNNYEINKDVFNEIRFKPIETVKMRLEVNLQPGVSSGVHEWRFN